jgi:hypothetical protein
MYGNPSRSIAIVVQGQRDDEQFGYWSDAYIVRGIKHRLRDSALTGNFAVAHVRYLPSESRIVQSPRILDDESGGEMAWV